MGHDDDDDGCDCDGRARRPIIVDKHDAARARAQSSQTKRDDEISAENGMSNSAARSSILSSQLSSFVK